LEAKFTLPNIFEVKYDSAKVTQQQILSLEVFKTYKATVLDESNTQQLKVKGNSGSNQLNGINIDFYLRKGKSQANIYAFLLNKNDKKFENYCVDLYYPGRGELERYCFRVDEEEALRDICLAVEKGEKK